MEALFRERSGIVLVPVLFVALFFLIYLPHAMAHLGALRYLLPVESIAICTLFALPVSSSTPKLSRAGWVVLCLWLAYNAIEMRNVVRAHGPEKRATLEHRELLLAGIAASGLKHALIVSSPVFAHHGHQLTFWTGNRVKFVSAFDERYQPAAQEAEADPDLGLIYETPMRSSVEAALAALGASYNIIEEPWASLVNQIKVPLSSRRSVSPEQLRMELHGDTDGDANAMIDRRYDTAVRGALSSASGFTMDLGEVRRIDGLWLTAPDWLQLKLPAGYRVSVSRDGKKFREVARTDHRIALAYHCGDRVYMKGYFGFQEICFAPVEARYVRYDVTQGQRGETHWKINEVFVMEYLGSTADDWRDDVDRVAESIRAQQIDFTVADRWLSARLWNLLPHPKGRPPVYPRFNPRHRETIVLRDVNPRPGLAIAPALEIADECEARLRELYGDAVEWTRTDGEQYALLSILKAEAAKSPRRLIWNGHVLLTDEGPRGRVY